LTLTELRNHPLWKLLSPDIRKTLTAAQEHGWELHGRGATIVFRLDRAQDELDMPLYVTWEIGVTPTGGSSWRGGKGGTPAMHLSLEDTLDYLQDPSAAYAMEDDCLPSEDLLSKALGASPTSSSISVSGVVTSGPPEPAGARASAPSTGTISPLLRITSASKDSGATDAGSPGTSGTSLRLTKESDSSEPENGQQKSVLPTRPLRLRKPNDQAS
jgi:hypothetical protein